jgi:fructose-1,6-bisphosphatase
MYLVKNNNLLYHGCIPMKANGLLRHFTFGKENHAPRDFMDRLERLSRQGYFANDDLKKKQYGMDTMWYLWTGAQSPLFGKDKMATFERYFIDDSSTHTENMNPCRCSLSNFERVWGRSGKRAHTEWSCTRESEKRGEPCKSKGQIARY